MSIQMSMMMPKKTTTAVDWKVEFLEYFLAVEVIPDSCLFMIIIIRGFVSLFLFILYIDQQKTTRKN